MIDDWTIAVSGDQRHVDLALVKRIMDQLLVFWSQFTRVGVDVVLDFASWDRPVRDRVRTDAARLGADVELICVQCDQAERRRRCIARSTQDGSIIDGDGFDWIETNRSVDRLAEDGPHVALLTGWRIAPWLVSSPSDRTVPERCAAGYERGRSGLSER